MKKLFAVLTIFMFALVANILLAEFYGVQSDSLNESYAVTPTYGYHSGHIIDSVKYPSNSAAYHEYRCVTCNVAIVREAHEYKTYTTSRGTTVTTKICTICGISHELGSEHTHDIIYGTYNGWFVNEDIHYLKCNSCNAQLHSDVYPDIALQHHFNANGICTVCTYKKDSSSNSDFDYGIQPQNEDDCKHNDLVWGQYNGWLIDDDTHYLECKNCHKHLPSPSYPDIPLAHNFDSSGTCTVCRYNKYSGDELYGQDELYNNDQDFHQASDNVDRSVANDNIMVDSGLTVNELVAILREFADAHYIDSDMLYQIADAALMAQRNYGINALTMATICIAESSLGTSDVAQNYNNVAGVCTYHPEDDSVTVNWYNNIYESVDACAQRVYSICTGEVTSELDPGYTYKDDYGNYIDTPHPSLYRIGRWYNGEYIDGQDIGVGYANRLNNYYNELYGIAEDLGIY